MTNLNSDSNSIPRSSTDVKPATTGAFGKGTVSRAARFYVEFVLTLIAVLVATALSYLRRFPGFVEAPYWYLTYKSGFIRRGLVGTFVSPFLVGHTYDEGITRVAEICTAVAAIYLLLLILLAMAIRAAIPVPRLRYWWLLVVFVALASPGLPNLAQDLGTLDTIMALVAILGLVALLTGALVPALLCAVIGPLIHEAFIFLFLPLLLSVWGAWPSQRRAAILSASATILTTLTIWHFSLRHFTWQPGVPISQKDLADFAAWQLGQGLQLTPWSNWKYNLMDGTLTWTIVSILAMIAFVRALLPRQHWALARIVGGTVFSMSIAIVAIDTARLMNWGCLTAPILCGLEVAGYWRGRSQHGSVDS